VALYKRIGVDDVTADMDDPNPEFWEPVEAPAPESTEAAPAAQPEESDA
jgi:hypothetical protein